MYPIDGQTPARDGRRSLAGRIDYLTAAGRRRGRELFTVEYGADGRRTLQVVCEFDESGLVRHVTQTVDRKFQPLQAHVRIERPGGLDAAGLYGFTATEVVVATTISMAEPGITRHRIDAPVRAFGTHPLAVDGWMAGLFDHGGPPCQALHGVWVSSRAFDGGDGVGLLPVTVGLKYVGREWIETAAGRFDCHHFRYLLDASGMDHPPYETWVTTDGECLLVRAWAGPPLDYVYELAAVGPLAACGDQLTVAGLRGLAGGAARECPE